MPSWGDRIEVLHPPPRLRQVPPKWMPALFIGSDDVGGGVGVFALPQGAFRAVLYPAGSWRHEQTELPV